MPLQSCYTARIVLGMILVWLGWAYWARMHYLPYDVNNTDVGTYLFQAQTFASGNLCRETPEPREFFQQWQAVIREKSYAYYPPVHALLLSLPLVLHLNPWFVPWILSAASILFTFLFVRKVSNERTALLAACFLALSPFFTANAASLLNHSSALFFTVACLFFIVRSHGGLKRMDSLLAGVMLGLLFATRPLNALALGLVWIPWSALTLFKTSEVLLKWLTFFTVGLGMIFLPTLLYYHSLAGYWTLDLFKDYWPRNKYGFGVGLGRGEPGHYFQTYSNHDWYGWITNVKYSLVALARWWTGSEWLTLALGIAAIGIFVLRKKISQIYVVAAAWVVAQVFLYAFYFTQSTPPSGPRYLTEIMPALALLSAGCVTAIYRSRLKLLVPLILTLFLAVSSWFKWNFYADNLHAIPARKQVEECVINNTSAPAIVFIRSFWLGHPFPIFLNTPDLNGPIIFACDRGIEDFRLVQAHPDRNAYVLSVSATSRSSINAELIPVYQSADRRWLRPPEEIEAPFFVGSKFSEPLKLKGEIFQKLFHPRPDQIVPQ